MDFAQIKNVGVYTDITTILLWCNLISAWESVSLQYKNSDTYLWDNERSCTGVVCEKPRALGEWYGRNLVIIRPNPGCFTLKQPGHYSHCDKKLANSRYFHWTAQLSLNLASRSSSSWKSIEHWHVTPPYLNNCNRTDGIKVETSTDLLGYLPCFQSICNTRLALGPSALP